MFKYTNTPLIHCIINFSGVFPPCTSNFNDTLWGKGERKFFKKIILQSDSESAALS